MFDIYGVPPHGTGERKVTTRTSEAEAAEFVKNLEGFGWTSLRVQAAGAVSPAEQSPAVTEPPVLEEESEERARLQELLGK